MTVLQNLNKRIIFKKLQMSNDGYEMMLYLKHIPKIDSLENFFHNIYGIKLKSKKK